MNNNRFKANACRSEEVLKILDAQLPFHIREGSTITIVFLLFLTLISVCVSYSNTANIKIEICEANIVSNNISRRNNFVTFVISNSSSHHLCVGDSLLIRGVIFNKNKLSYSTGRIINKVAQTKDSVQIVVSLNDDLIPYKGVRNDNVYECKVTYEKVSVFNRFLALTNLYNSCST